MKEEKINGRSLYEVESDLRSISQAEKIQHDSNRLGAVKTLVDREMSALAKIANKHKQLGNNGMYNNLEAYHG